MSDDRWREGLVGAAAPPLEEPWFLREARRQREAGAARREQAETVLRSEAMISPRADAADENAVETMPEPRRRGTWWPFAAGAGIALAAFAGVAVLGGDTELRRPATSATRITARSAAAPSALPAAAAAPTCGTPAVIEDLRAAIAARSREAGARDANALRQALARLSIGPAVADGGSCAARLSLWLPDADGQPRELATSATYAVGADPDGRPRVAAVEGIGELVARLAAPPAATALDETPVPSASIPPQPVPVQAESRSPAPGRPVEVAEAEPKAGRAEPAERAVPPPATGARSAASAGGCAATGSFIELLVCDDPGLAALDTQASALLAGIVRHADRNTADAALDGQQAFLSRRDRCGGEACVARLYRRRIAELADFGYPPG